MALPTHPDHAAAQLLHVRLHRLLNLQVHWKDLQEHDRFTLLSI